MRWHLLPHPATVCEAGDLVLPFFHSRVKQAPTHNHADGREADTFGFPEGGAGSPRRRQAQFRRRISRYVSPVRKRVRKQKTTRVLMSKGEGQMVAGILACLDGYMNISMEQTEEYINGQLRNKYGDAFIRGNNGTLLLFVSLCSIIRAHSATSL